MNAQKLLDAGAVYCPVVLTPVGRVPLIGCTMTDEREREVARTCALRDMPRWGLEPVEENLAAYFAMVREAL